MILCLIGFFLTACGTTKTEVITEYETKTVIRDRYVKIDVELTKPVQVIKPQKMKPETDTIDIIVALQLQQNEARVCNGKLAEIANLADTVKED